MESSKPLIARRETMLLYVRHPTLAALDPLEVALMGLANVQLRDKLPSYEELNGFDAIVAVATNPLDPLFPAAIRLRGQMTKPIPLLNLASGGQNAQAAAATFPEGLAPYPISLRSLAQFVSTLNARS